MPEKSEKAILAILHFKLIIIAFIIKPNQLKQPSFNLPFTFSHPAIVLPFAKISGRWISLTGLIVGSLTPDFEYFLRMRVQSKYSHTLGGLFWFDIPLGLVLAFIFHNSVRDRLFQNLPLALQSRFLVFKSFNWNRYFKTHWLVVISSIFTGAASHLFWDSFTHEQGYFVQTFPVLNSPIRFGDWKIPVFKILQHTSTVTGGLLIALVIHRLPFGSKATFQQPSIRYWLTLATLALLIFFISVLNRLSYHDYGNLIVTGISASMLSLITVSWLMKVSKNE